MELWKAYCIKHQILKFDDPDDLETVEKLNNLIRQRENNEISEIKFDLEFDKFVKEINWL